MQRLLFLLAISFLPGCVMKGEHLRLMAEKDKVITDLQKDKTELQSLVTKRTDDLNKMTTDRDRLDQVRQDLEAKYAQLLRQKKQCEERVLALSSQGGDQSRRLQAALEQIQKLQEIANRRKELFDRIKNSFKAMTEAGKLRVRFVRGMLLVQLEEKILFASGASTLKKEGSEAIEQLTLILKGMNRRWQVAGHTDDVGQARFNWDLSVRRAMAVLQVMLKAQMPPELISAAGFGQYQPNAPNDSKENKARNRRTEIMLVPNLEELQLASADSSPQALCSLHP